MQETMRWFEENRFVAVIRTSSADDAEAMVKAAQSGGFRIFEINMNTPQANRLIESCSKQDGICVGAGSVTDGEVAQRAINAGAKFLSNVYTDRDVINVAKNNHILTIQGAFTPNEALTAHQWGADIVQIYPCDVAGGPDYFKTLRQGPFPNLKMMAHGGVQLENVAEYLKYCVAVAVDRALFDRPLLRADNWTEIAERARQFVHKLESPAKVHGR